MKKPVNNNKLIKLSREEFDKYMCKTYPELFKQRNKPMSETSMCWGFDIGKGWYFILDELCQHLDRICKLAGADISFDQVKEKYGSARFYISEKFPENMAEEDKNFWDEIIYALIDKYETMTSQTCALTGEQYFHEKIVIGNWVHDLSEKGYLKAFPDRKDVLKDWKKRNEIRESIEYKLNGMDIEGLKKIKEFVEEMKK